MTAYRIQNESLSLLFSYLTIQNQSLKAEQVLINSYILSEFNYCLFVWMFCNQKSALKKKITILKKRAVRFLLDDNISYHEDLLEKAVKIKMRVSRKELYVLKLIIQ